MTKVLPAAFAFAACLISSSAFAAPDEAQVTLPYAEFKSLQAAQDETARKSRAPLASSVAAAHYTLNLEGGMVSGSAEFEVRTFSEEWQVVPLLSTMARLTAVEPAASRVVMREGRYGLLTHAEESTTVTLHFVLPWSSRSGENPRLVLPGVDALITTLAIGGRPPDREVSVAHATRLGEEYRLDPGAALELELMSPAVMAAAEERDTLPRVAIAAAVADSATSQMRVVPDGSILNEMRYLVRHKEPVKWILTLPGGSELLSFAVDGRSFAPIDRGGGALQIDLPAAGDKPTEIVFSYSNRVEPLAPVSGRLELELPLTPLLIHDVQWQIDLPAGFELAALEGNVVGKEAVNRDGVLRIRVQKELCRNQRPAVQIFYRKPLQ